jgi:hypothetical protein
MLNNFFHYSYCDKIS